MLYGVGAALVAAPAFDLQWPQPVPIAPLPGEPPAGYPRALVAEDGSFLLIAGGSRVYRVNADLTQTERLGTIPEVKGGGRGVPFRAADGTLMAACNDNDEQARQYSAKLFESPDEGRTWTHTGTVVASHPQGIWEPFPLLLPDGTVLVAYSREYPNPEFRPYQVCELKRSTDNGRTWSEPIRVASHPRSRDGMPIIARMPTGRLICVFEATDAGHCNIRSAVSDDGGKTWHGRALVHDPADKSYTGAPFVLCLSDGALLVCFQTEEWSGQVDFGLVSSADGGETWSDAAPILATPGPEQWGALYNTPDGRILALTSSHREGRQAVFATLGTARGPSAGR